MGDAESLVSNKQLVGLLCSMFYPDSNPDKTPRLPCQDDCYGELMMMMMMIDDDDDDDDGDGDGNGDE